MDFEIRSLEESEFAGLFTLSDMELEKLGMVRMVADKFPGFPCRISLKDVEIGEEVILLPYEHHKTMSPYKAAGPIFVSKAGKTTALGKNEIPAMLQHRLLSLRGYDKNGMMKVSSVMEGKNLKEEITNMFGVDEIAYIHIHNAKAGCYNCMVLRA